MIPRLSALAVPITALAVCAPAAVASRAPTAVEKTAIVRGFQPAFPARCVAVRVSSVDGRFAVLRLRTPVSRSCLPVAFDGIAVLRRRSAGHWRILLAASADADCSVIARRVLVDLRATGVCA